MMLIDGSYGEGGGQILRTAIALSCILGVDVKIINIRKGRKQPGLRNQHLHGLKLAAEICDAELLGARIGSVEVEFKPREVKGGYYRVDIGTAGSITLILKTVIPIALHSNKELRFILSGGTDVPFSPPMDYYLHVFFPLLEIYGAKIYGKVIRRGYYPEGGGVVEVVVEPNPLQHLDIKERGEYMGNEAYINIANLPEHICNRMRKKLNEFSTHCEFSTTISRGCGLLILQKYRKTVISGDQLCRKGLPAEKVVDMAMTKLQKEIESNATVDVHMADHLPVLAFVAGYSRYKVSKITEHARTNLWVVEKFGAKTRIEDKNVEIRI